MHYGGGSNNQAGYYKGLKAEPHAANGGIGISYSNVMLGGINTIADPGQQMPHTTYRNHYDRNGNHDVGL